MSIAQYQPMTSINKNNLTNQVSQLKQSFMQMSPAFHMAPCYTENKECLLPRTPMHSFPKNQQLKMFWVIEEYLTQTCGLGFVHDLTLTMTPPPQEALHGVLIVDHGLLNKLKLLIKLFSVVSPPSSINVDQNLSSVDFRNLRNCDDKDCEYESCGCKMGKSAITWINVILIWAKNKLDLGFISIWITFTLF